MRRLLPLLITAAILVGVPLPAGGASDTTHPELLVSAIPPTLVRGDRFEMRIQTCGPALPRTALVQRRTGDTGRWSRVRSSPLDSTGVASFDLRPMRVGEYQFRILLTGAGIQASLAQTVTVVPPTRARPAQGLVSAPAFTTSVATSALPPTLRKGSRAIFSVATCPAAQGDVAMLQRRVAPDGRWSVVRRTVVDASGEAHATVRPMTTRTFDFRWKVGAPAPLVTASDRVRVVDAGSTALPTSGSSRSTSEPAPSSGSVEPSRSAVLLTGVPATLVSRDTFDMQVTTTPAQKRAQLTVQKRIGDGPWFTVRTSRLTASGTKTIRGMKPIAPRDYSFRVIVRGSATLTSPARDVTVLRPTRTTTSDSNSPTTTPKTPNTPRSSVPRYQLWDQRADQWLPRGQWVTLQSYPTRVGVPTKNILQLTMAIRRSTGTRPTHVLVGWLSEGQRRGVHTFSLPSSGGDGPFQLSHDYSMIGAAGTTSVQLFVPGSGQVRIATEVAKAIAHPQY